MTSSELIYLAGFIDGEGSFIINKRLHSLGTKTWIGYSIYIDVTNTNQKVIEWIKKVTKNNSQIYSNKSLERNPKRKKAYSIRINGKVAQELTKELSPYLIVKSEQAKVFMDFPLFHKKIKKEIRENLFQKMKELNHRGNY